MRILVVDDEPGIRSTVSQILAEEGYQASVASDASSALAQLEAGDFDLVLCDVRMPGMSGLEFLSAYRSRDAGGSALVVMMSAYGDDEAAVEAIRSGAYDYISKPFRAETLLLVVRKAVEREKLRSAVRRLSDELSEARGSGGIIGSSAQTREAIALAIKVARHPSTVLITGESGTGKELIARLIHNSSPRAETPFIAVNCGAIPASLLESELFGHARGAFTGASSSRKGLFEEADGGTLFLDEIGELPLELQVKLLRALQEGEIRRLGEEAVRKVDVRVLAATARELEAEVSGGTFRSDLYYRLNVVRLHLAPLRHRTEDISELVRHFAETHSRRMGVPLPAIEAGALALLLRHPWPGNVRELENVVERAMIFSDDGSISEASVSFALRPRSGPQAIVPDSDMELSVKKRTAQLERELIGRALERTGGNRTRAAELLELSHRALLYKIRDYGIGD